MVFKLILTVLTLSAGYQGGEVMPMFTIGATLGAVLAPLFHLPADFVAALGYASVFGSGTGTFWHRFLLAVKFSALITFLICLLSFVLPVL